MEIFRRKATAEELAQGEKEMREEQERLRKERFGEFLEQEDASVARSLMFEGLQPEKLDEERGEQVMDRILQEQTALQEQLREREEAGFSGPRGSEMPSPGQPQPLFDEAQLKRLRELEMQAPLLLRREPELQRPTWMVDEEKRQQELEQSRDYLKQQQMRHLLLKDEEKLLLNKKVKELEEENEKLQKSNEMTRTENDVIAKENQKIAKENEDMRRLLRRLVKNDGEGVTEESWVFEEEPRFSTPEEEKKYLRPDGGDSGKEVPMKPSTTSGDPQEGATPMDLMMKMMSTMQRMVEKSEERKEGEGKGEVEIVRSGVIEMPQLPEWSIESGPLDMGDWLTQVQPIMGDLTTSSNVWWDLILQESKKWYLAHQALGPMERLTHLPSSSVELKDVKWGRLERRATSLLLSSLPPSQREEMIATKTLSPLGIVSKLMVIYQPGGLSEKGIILRNLENPQEAASLSAALQSLRRWLQWKRRAEEVGVALPDATILVRGLNKITKRILESNKELNFRISLAKTTLMVESVPQLGTVHQLAEHLIAEVEQVVHLDLRPKKEEGKAAVKRIEMDGGSVKGGGKGKEDSPTRKDEQCRFFLTDGGCKKGKACGWKHALDDQRRCWSCGARDHYSNACPRAEKSGGENEKGFKGGAKGKDGKGMSRMQKKEEERAEESGPQKESEKEKASETSSEAETMKGLLEEANKMLKGISARNADQDRLSVMQQQLDELRKMKVLRLTKLIKGPTQGLIDSGATNPLRGRKKDERLEDLQEVWVTLATGEKVAMRMTKSGVMVHEDEHVEPIIPMGLATEELGYEIVVKEGKCRMFHPVRGEVAVEMKNGCPQVSKKIALKMIEEYEKKNVKMKRVEVQTGGERKWLEDFVLAHPVLRELPEHVRQSLVDTPSETLHGLPDCNRRRRKLLEEGFVVYIYAGEKEGYSLARAMKEVGGDPRRLVEIDILREKASNDSHDMLKSGGVYSTLLRASLNGLVLAVITSPNCRTRSVLRHYPLPQGRPRPVRSWEEPWGKKDLLPEEKRITEEDDVLMWRSLMVYILSAEINKMFGTGLVVRLGLEQPADPYHYMPQVVSFWRTSEWAALRWIYGLDEQTFNQSSWGGKAVKPTTFGGNLLLQLPEGETRVEGNEIVTSSKELSRWAPGFVREVGVQLQRQVMKGEVRMKKMSWEEHVHQGHTPFRRDCVVCQEAAARGRMHGKMLYPKAGVLSLDVSGPYVKGRDVEGEAKFMLIGAYTKLGPKEDRRVEEKEEEVPEEELVPLLEVIDDDDAEEEEKNEDEVEIDWDLGEDREEKEGNQPPSSGALGSTEDVSRDAAKREVENPTEVEEREEREDPKIETIRVGVPISGKTKEEVLSAIADIYLKLRIDGHYVHTIHTDQGREFVNRDLKAWMRARGIVHSTNSGEDPKANGRAERSVGESKSRVRRLLHAAGMTVDWWPFALRFAMETDRLKRRGDSLRRIPGFGEKVVIRRRNWKTKLLEPTHETSTYLVPMLEAHGHCVLREDGRTGVAPYVIKGVQKPEIESERTWIGFLEEADKDEMKERRRIRGKQPVQLQESEEAIRLRRLLREEAEMIDVDESKNSRMMFMKLDPIRKRMKKMEMEDQEILQTKIISPHEMVRDIGLWDEAIRSEMKSLLEDKEALRTLTSKEKEVLEGSGEEIEVVPSKLVITRKAGGRRKIRIVACGNYIPKKQEEDVFASGSDAVGVRVALKKASMEDWDGVSIDIKTAFLNAPLPGEGKKENVEEIERVAKVLIKPPPLLVKLKYVKEGDWWLALKAMYGLRQSPKVWGDHRDSILQGFEWKSGKKCRRLEQALSEPNMWKVMEEQGEVAPTLKGLVMMYVDDALILGGAEVVKEVVEKMREVWEISKPEWLGDEAPVRFLGMDLWKGNYGVFVSQEAYIRDVLKRRGGEQGACSGIPITRDQAQRLEEPQGTTPTPEEVREAQKITGEVMWVLTRSRPDLMFVMSKMCQNTLRNPTGVIQVGNQVLMYLRKTKDQGLMVSKNRGGVEVYTDSSYGPGGHDSQGAVLVTWGGSVIMWKSGRQTLAPLSTAESELQEGIEGMTMGDSCDVLIMEVEMSAYQKVLKVDNQAAVNLLTEPSGSWRTRHLRLRASHLRWRIGKMDWLIEAIPGEIQIADIGTKALTITRLEDLKKLMEMAKNPKDKGESCEEGDAGFQRKKDDKEGEDQGQRRLVFQRDQGLEEALRFILMAASISCGKSQGHEERREVADYLEMIVALLLMMIGLVSILTRLMNWIKRCLRRTTRERELVPQRALENSSLPEGLRRRPKSCEEDMEKASSSTTNRNEGEYKKDEEHEKRNVVEEEGKKEEEKSTQKEDGGSEKGRSVGTSHGETALSEVSVSGTSFGGALARGSGTMTMNFATMGGVPSSSSGGDMGPRISIYITPYGTKFHNYLSCPSLRNSRRLQRSPFCMRCAQNPTNDQPFVVYSLGANEMIHYSRNCPDATNCRGFARCGLCRNIDG